jgi:uncharacterized protein (DUF4415 family)
LSKFFSSETLDEWDEYPEITQKDMDQAVFRVGLKPVPSKKQRITIELDSALVAYFKSIAGEDGYGKLINDTLRRALEQDDLEDTLRRIVREELDHESPSRRRK